MTEPAPDVQRKHLLVVRFFNFRNRSQNFDAGIIEGHVELTEFTHGFFDDALIVGVARRVRLDKAYLAPIWSAQTESELWISAERAADLRIA